MVLNLVRTLLSLIFPLITFPYASRVLGPEGIGRVNYSQSIIGYFAIIASFGIGTYAIREVSKVRDDKEALSKLSIEILLVNLITTFFAYILFFITIVVSTKLFEYRSLLYICSLTMFFTTIGMEWLYISTEDYLYITVRSILVKIISLVLLFIIVRTSQDYLNYAILLVFANVGANVWNLLYSRKYIKWNGRYHLRVFRHFKYVCVFFITALTATLHTVLDQSMLGYFMGDREVGIYVTAVKISDLVIAVICAMTAILFPRLSYLVKNGNKGEWKGLFEKTLDFLMMVSIPCVVALTLLGKPTIYLLAGNQFSETVPVLSILNFMIIIVVFTNIIGNQLFMATNKEKWTLLSVTAGVLLNIVLNYLLIPKYAAMGAAVASVLAEGLVLGVQLYLLTRLLTMPSILRKMFIYIVDSLIMAVVIYFISHNVSVNYFLQLIVSAISGLLIYGCLLLVQKNSIAIQIIRLFSQRFHRSR